MRFAVYGLLFAALVFLISGGHLLFIPLFFLLPLGGMFGHRRRLASGLKTPQKSGPGLARLLARAPAARSSG